MSQNETARVRAEMGKPVASIVVPVGGVDAALSEQVQAIAASHGDISYEVVLACNSASPDDLASLEQIARDQGAHWSVVNASTRRGPAHARNVGARAATADLLLFCDADDIVVPGWLEAMVATLAEVDAASGPLPPFGSADDILRWKAAPGAESSPTYMGTVYMPSANIGVRRSAFEEVGGFDERLRTAEDIAFSWSLVVAGRTVGWSPDAAIRRRYRTNVRSLLRQHFAYGRGISRLLLWYGLPGNGVWLPPGRALLRGSGEDAAGERRDLRSVVRRAALAAGRLVGIVEISLLRRS